MSSLRGAHGSRRDVLDEWLAFGVPWLLPQADTAFEAGDDLGRRAAVSDLEDGLVRRGCAFEGRSRSAALVAEPKPNGQGLWRSHRSPHHESVGRRVLARDHPPGGATAATRYSPLRVWS